MKTIKKQVKTIALMISVLMCFQSCKVYYRDSVSLEQAVNENKRTKLETKNNQTFVFKSIIKEKDQYFGLKKEKGEIIKVQIYQKDIEKLRLQNKSLSTISTISIILLTTLGLFIGGAAIAFSGGII